MAKGNQKFISFRNRFSKNKNVKDILKYIDIFETLKHYPDYLLDNYYQYFLSLPNWEFKHIFYWRISCSDKISFDNKSILIEKIAKNLAQYFVDAENKNLVKFKNNKIYNRYQYTIIPQNLWKLYGII